MSNMSTIKTLTWSSSRWTFDLSVEGECVLWFLCAVFHGIQWKKHPRMVVHTSVLCDIYEKHRGTKICKIFSVGSRPWHPGRAGPWLRTGVCTCLCHWPEVCHLRRKQMNPQSCRNNLNNLLPLQYSLTRFSWPLLYTVQPTLTCSCCFSNTVTPLKQRLQHKVKGKK